MEFIRLPVFVVMGALMALGLVLNLLVPGWGETRSEMQIMHMLHSVAAMVIGGSN